MRLLYVEDDRINTLLFVETCRLGGGLEVRTASDGAEALVLAAEWQPEALVIDLHLPDVDGYALLARLRTIGGMQAVPAFLCSAETADDVAAPAAAAGFDGVWPKPVVLDTMLADLARLLGGR